MVTERISIESVNRRIGGLEKHCGLIIPHVSVNRRIGGLEKM